MLNTYTSPTRHTFINCFCIVICYFLLPAAPHHYLFLVISLSVSLAPHLLSWRGTPSTWMLSTPASRQPLLLVSVPCALCLHLPSFFIRLTPLCLLHPATRSLTASGVSPVCFLPSCVSLFFIPLLHRFLASSCVWFPNWVSVFARG